MSKPSTTQRPIPFSQQLPARSAWAKGPPQTTSSSSSPRSQSPVIPSSQNGPQQSGSHSRRPSTLSGEPVAVDPSVSRNAPSKTASMQFGSIDQPPATPAPAAASAPAPASTAAAAAPPANSSSPAQKLKSFGTIPNSTINGSTSSPSPTPPQQASSALSKSPSPAPSSGTSTPAKTQRAKIDIKKFFQGGGAPTPSTTASPAHAPVPMPPTGPPSSFTPHPHPQPLPPQVQTPFTPYSPSNAARPLPSSHGPSANGGPVGNNNTLPRSPSYPRQLANGSPSPAPGQTPRSPRIAVATPGGVGPGPSTPGPVQGGPPQMHFNGQQQQPMMWPYHYYGGYEQQYMSQPGYPYYNPMPPPHHQQHPQQHQPPHPAQHVPSQHPHPHPSHLQPTPHPHSPHLAPALPATTNNAMSPRTIPAPLSSAPPASPSLSSPATAGLRTTAPTFVPRSRTVTIKDASGKEIDLRNPANAHKREPSFGFVPPAAATVAPSIASNLQTPEKKRPTSIRLESEQDRKARLDAAEKEKREKEEEQKRKEEEEKQRERKAKEEEERKKREEEERVLKAKEEERKKREEAERLRREQEEKEAEERRKKEEEERLQREEEERLKREEEERFKKEEEEKERLRKEEEEREKERLRLEEEERERKRKEEQEAAERERQRLEEEAAKAKAREEEEKRVALGADAKEPSVVTPPPPGTSPATPTVTPRRRPVPGPLDLTSAQRPGLPPSLPSALATARIISNLDEITYPEGIKSPRVELNQNAKEGKFKYDRDFLLQFMQICKEKPDNLPPLDAIGIEPLEPGAAAHGMHRERSQRRSISQNSAPQQQAGRPPIGVGIPPFNQFKQPTRMGEFGMGPGASGMRHVTVASGLGNVPFPNKQPALTRPPSTGGPNGVPNQVALGGDRRHRGSRNAKNRTDGNRVNSNASSFAQHNSMQPPLEPVAPLQSTENRWTPNSLVSSRKGPNMDETSPEILDRKVKGLLNKLTMEKFDSISDQIIEWANKSEKENDGRTLMRVIRLVFEKATDEATWSEMYARLCRKMHEKISPGVIDESIKTQDGKPFSGGQLFRKYLLNRCQDDFERGWQKKDAAEAAAAAKAETDKAAESSTAEGDEVLYSEEYYIAQKAKRQGLGLVKFIGELFKLQMLTERIMHQCIKKLLSNVDNPAEEEIESLCKLLSTVGEQLDSPKAKNHMDVYFARMKELAASPRIAPRMQYMLLDVIELRQRRWSTRTQVAAPTTLAAVHEQAAKDKEKAATMAPMSRGGSRRGGDARNDYNQPGADGWTTAGGGAANAPRPPPSKVGDLTMFGKINKAGPASFGPSAAFKKTEVVKRDSGNLSRTASSSNMYAALAGGTEVSSEPPLSRGSQPPSRKPSADFTQTGIPDAAGSVRRRLKLLPRSIPVASEGADPKDETEGGDSPAIQTDSEPEEGEIRDEEDGNVGEDVPAMSDEEAMRKIKEDVKELFSIRNLEDSAEYFSVLPVQYHSKLVDKIVTQVLDLKEKDAQFVAQYFTSVREKDLCSLTSFEEGFVGSIEFLEDISVDVPAAYKLVAILLKGAQLPDDALERLADKVAVDGEPLKPPREKLLDEVRKLN